MKVMTRYPNHLLKEMWIIYNNIAISFIPKNASTSIRNFTRSEPVTNKEAMQYPRRVAVLREPIERLVSGYSFFHELYERGSKTGVIEANLVKDWPTYIDHVLSESDPHWAPQVDQLSIDGEYIATETIRMEDLPSFWRSNFSGMIPYINGCVHKPVSEYRVNDIEKRYKRDIELWSGL